MTDNVRFALTGPDVAIIIGSLLLVVGVGLWAARRPERTARGYFLASGRLPWWIIGSAFVSTSVSSEQIVGTVGAAYEYGMGIANWEWCSLPVYTLLMVFFVPVYLRNRVTTVSEFLLRRFGPVCADVYSWAMLVAYVFVFLVPVFYGGATAISDLTRWPFHAVLCTMVVAVALYTVKGGLRSVMWTDALQCLLLVGGGMLLFFVALGRVDGGWDAMMRAAPDRFHLYCPADHPKAPFPGLVTAMCGVILFYQAGNQVMIQRVLGARSAWDGYMGIIFAGFINFLRPLVTCFLGLIVWHLINVQRLAEPLEKQDYAFSFALRTLAPAWGLRGMVLAGFLAAVMSTLSAVANSTATLFALDVYRKLINRGADEAQTVRVGRVASLAALATAAAVSPAVSRLGGIFTYFQTGVTYLATPFLSALLLGILWKRANYAGGIFAVIGGIMIQTIVAAAFPLAGLHLHWLYLAFFAQVLTLAGAVIVSLATAPPPRALWEPFQWSPSLLSLSSDGARRPWYKRLMLWYAIYAAIWFSLYWRYW